MLPPLKTTIAVLGLLLAGIVVIASAACNEVLCASVVSKCMLTQACKCDINRHSENCSCCADCHKCLGVYYDPCCECVELCPGKIVLDRMDSVVGDIPEPFPVLFKAMTAEKDSFLRWTSTTFKVDLSKSLEKDKDKKKKYLEVHPQDTAPPIMGNCTVAYMSQCMSNVKCKNSCSQMGGSAYRYFFDGCCECVGKNCLNYGINESRCLECPEIGIDDYDEEIIDGPALTNHLEDDYTE